MHFAKKKKRPCSSPAGEIEFRCFFEMAAYGVYSMSRGSILVSALCVDWVFWFSVLLWDVFH